MPIRIGDRDAGILPDARIASVELQLLGCVSVNHGPLSRPASLNYVRRWWVDVTGLEPEGNGEGTGAVRQGAIRGVLNDIGTRERRGSASDRSRARGRRRCRRNEGNGGC